MYTLRGEDIVTYKEYSKVIDGTIEVEQSIKGTYLIYLRLRQKAQQKEEAKENETYSLDRESTEPRLYPIGIEHLAHYEQQQGEDIEVLDKP